MPPVLDAPISRRKRSEPRSYTLATSYPMCRARRQADVRYVSRATDFRPKYEQSLAAATTFPRPGSFCPEEMLQRYHQLVDRRLLRTITAEEAAVLAEIECQIQQHEAKDEVESDAHRAWLREHTETMQALDKIVHKLDLILDMSSK